jgi:hypothetical protein
MIDYELGPWNKCPTVFISTIWILKASQRHNALLMEVCNFLSNKIGIILNYAWRLQLHFWYRLSDKYRLSICKKPYKLFALFVKAYLSHISEVFEDPRPYYRIALENEYLRLIRTDEDKPFAI